MEQENPKRHDDDFHSGHSAVTAPLSLASQDWCKKKSIKKFVLFYEMCCAVSSIKAVSAVV